MKNLLKIATLAIAMTVLFVGVVGAAPLEQRFTPPGQANGPAFRANPAPETTAGPCLADPAAQRGMRGMRGMPEWAGQPDEVATLLGMTVEEIQAERQAGKSLAEIAAAKNVSKETLIDTILNAKKALLTQLVADGKLSQAQMDLMAERMESQIETMVDRTTTGPQRGAMQQGMPMGRGGRWNFQR